jgi:hypothetical protein
MKEYSISMGDECFILCVYKYFKYLVTDAIAHKVIRFATVLNIRITEVQIACFVFIRYTIFRRLLLCTTMPYWRTLEVARLGYISGYKIKKQPASL